MTRKSDILPGSPLKKQLMELRIAAGLSEQVYHQSALRMSQDTHRYDDTLHCHETTRDKINFMHLIIQCKNISCNKFSFLRKHENILTKEKDRSTVV